MTKLNVDSMVLVMGFRYALGRKSYSTSVAIDSIRENMTLISTGDLELFIKEITNAPSLGMAMDEKQWLLLKEELILEVNKRNNI